MTSTGLLRRRLANQQLSGHSYTRPEELLSWMGCIQAQDFAGAKWAIGNRIKGITDAAIEKDFSEGRILRTHILRPTWHFVCPADIGWMLRLTAPKIKAFNKGLHRRLGIDEAILRRSRNIIVKALTGGGQLTREQILALLRKGKIDTDDIRSNFLLMDAELDGIICSGPRHGKQFTYALLEERVPKLQYLDEDAAIAELTRRYFVSRGPATLPDFVWWSGLSLSNARKGIEMNRQSLTHEVTGGQACWFAAGMPPPSQPRKSAYLLPAFDEYTIAYKDRTDVLPLQHHKQAGNGIFKPAIILNGKIAGTWRRNDRKGAPLVELHPFTDLDDASQDLLSAAAARYEKFVNRTSTSLSA